MGNPVIVPVPAKMEKYYGSGTMLHPDIEIIENAIAAIPFGRVATIETLCRKLSGDYGTDVTCPMRTGNGIKKITETYMEHSVETVIPFWRVIRNNGMVINSKHTETCALRLEKEGFKLQFTQKGEVKVLVEDEDIYGF